jgi:general L-amino acid transport system permease protein
MAVARSYIRVAPLAPLPPPVSDSGAWGWLRKNFFSSLLNIVLTLLTAALIAWTVIGLADFLIVNATWSGSDREACLASEARPVVGACWPFVAERLGYFIYGFYPIAQRWRVDVFFALLALGIVWLLAPRAPARRLGAVYFFVVMPLLSYVLLAGWPLIGLPHVPTTQWGGMLVTVVVSAVGIVFSLPIGVVLALGRRSRMPLVKLFSVIFIEFVRGVPLITVLFMASVMLPLFVPEQWSPDKLLRALIGVALFASAYMAEVVRAGLQSVPRGQYEGAMAHGLSYCKMMAFIVLPQALRATIPNIVNSYIALFKDTTLVFIVGIFDFLRTIEAARIDPKWATPVTSTTGYAFAAIVYFIFCMLMSRYALGMERRLASGRRTRGRTRRWRKARP